MVKSLVLRVRKLGKHISIDIRFRMCHVLWVVQGIRTSGRKPVAGEGMATVCSTPSFAHIHSPETYTLSTSKLSDPGSYPPANDCVPPYMLR